MKTSSLIIYVFIVSFLSIGCSPVFKEREIFVPPESNAGLTCVSACNNLQSRCNDHCWQQLQDCKINARAEAKILFIDSMDRYSLDLDDYRASKRSYDSSYAEYTVEKLKLERRLAIKDSECQDHDVKSCKRKDIISKSLESLRLAFYSYGPLAHKPVAPLKPSLAAQSDNLIAKQCAQSCGCNKTFNACFVHCGGSVIIEKTCIRNCDRIKSPTLTPTSFY